MWRLKRNMTTGECWRRRSPNNCRCWLLLFAFFSGRLAVFSFSASQFLFCSHCLGSKCYTATTWPAGPLVRVLPSDYNACEATDQRTSQSTSPQLITPLLRQHNSKVAGGTVRPHTCGPRHKQLLPWSLILKLSRHFFRDTFQLISCPRRSSAPLTGQKDWRPSLTRDLSFTLRASWLQLLPKLTASLFIRFLPSPPAPPPLGLIDALTVNSWIFDIIVMSS